MTNIYQPFLNKIAATIDAKGGTRRPIADSLSDVSNYLLKAENRNFSQGRQISGIAEQTGLEQLAMLLGLPLKTPTLGNHVDFKNIAETGRPEYHYATSVFQDVKGSTAFFRKYTNEEVYVIIQTIAVATTHTHGLFSGHIQRMQYDGVFSYFSGKNIDERQATFNSLCATAFSTYFVRYELSKFFEERGLQDSIYTKTGIDYGSKDKVMWALFGVPGCSEVSTNSLHTSLAFKIQAKAYSDKICVGANVVQLLPTLSSYFSPHTDSDGTRNDVIWSDNKGFTYKYYDFAWERFLIDTYPDFVKRDGNRLYIDYNVSPSDINKVASLRNKALATKIGLGHMDTKGTYSTQPTHMPIPTTSKYAHEE